MASARRALAAVLAVGLLALAGCGSEPAAFSGRVLDNPYSAPTVTLTDTDGNPYSLAEDPDKRLTLVFFGYTNCPDICPRVLNNLAAAMPRLDEADREEVDVVFVTTDPVRDDEQRLRSYLDPIDPSFIGLTGDLDSIIAAGEPLAVYVSEGEKIEATGGYDLGGHTTTVSAVDSSGSVPIIWDQDTSPSQFAADIHSLLED